MGSSGSRAGMHTPWIDGVGVVAHPVHHHFHLQCIITHVCSGIFSKTTNNDYRRRITPLGSYLDVTRSQQHSTW